jgi:SAM-dependent methyltransferase
VVSSAGYKPLEAALYRGSPMFPYFSRNIFPLIYRECENCGCARINPAPHEAWVNWSPEGNDQSTIEMADWMEDREYIDDKVRSISGHYEKMGLEAFKTGGGAVLDVSCGTGVGLECLRDRFGWKRAEGVEFDRAAVRMATVRRQLRITHGLITSAKLEGGFDLVIMDNALEHHWSPRDALQSVFSQLRPGGGLFIVVPNFHGMAVELFGLEYHNMNWGHWHYFTVFSLMKLLRECGLEPVRAYSWFCDPMVQKKLGCIPEGTETDLDAQALTSLKASDKVFRGDFIQILARRSF